MGTTRFLALAAVLLLCACASVEPQYENKKASGAAVVRGTFANPVRLFQGEAYARIRSVDGLEAPRGMTPEIYLAAGKHRLTIELNNVGRESRVDIEADFERERVYRVASERVENMFVVKLLDETEGDAGKQEGRKVLQTVEVPVQKNIPIYVPILR